MKHSRSGIAFVLLALVACSDSSSGATDISAKVDPPADASGPGDPGDGSTPTADAGGDAAVDDANIRRVRIVAANTTSGSQTSYEPMESIRLFPVMTDLICRDHGTAFATHVKRHCLLRLLAPQSV